MCKVKKDIPFNVVRNFGVELEGYTNENIRENWGVSKWEFKSDGSLSDGGEECGPCDGNGRRYVSCPHCDGSHELECNECEGCYYWDCENCNGTGECEDEDGNSYNCEDCDGNGTIYCGYCEDGKIECPDCDSDGDIYAECPDCEGTGLVGDDDKFGVECVSDILNFENDSEALDRIFDYIGCYGWEPNSDCGTHIHVDCADLDVEGFRNLTLLAYAIEPVIYGMNEERYSNSYCKPIPQRFINKLLSSSFQSILTKSEFIDEWSDAGQGGRYWGLNWKAYRKHDTVEFRYFQGCDDVDEVKSWVELVVKLVELAKQTTFKEVLTIVNEIQDKQEFDEKVELIKDLLDIDHDYELKEKYTYRDCLIHELNIGMLLSSNQNIAM